MRMDNNVLIDFDNFKEMADEMGNELAHNFIRRAMEEAEEVALSDVAPEGMLDLAHRAHKAIGSAGLTGLSAVAFALKELEQAIRQNQEIKSSRSQILLVLSNTRQELKKLE